MDVTFVIADQENQEGKQKPLFSSSSILLVPILAWKWCISRRNEEFTRISVCCWSPLKPFSLWSSTWNHVLSFLVGCEDWGPTKVDLTFMHNPWLPSGTWIPWHHDPQMRKPNCLVQWEAALLLYRAEDWLRLSQRIFGQSWSDKLEVCFWWGMHLCSEMFKSFGFAGEGRKAQAL